MIKGVSGLSKFVRWFKCIILDRHLEVKLPYCPSGSNGLVEIYKCRYCGRTRCDYTNTVYLFPLTGCGFSKTRFNPLLR